MAASCNDKLTLHFFPSVCSKARVKPGCGRLVGFSSGPVNPHGVTAVTSGRRCALALWYTKEKLYRDMVSTMMISHSADLLLRSDVSHLLTDVVTTMLETRSSSSIRQMWWLLVMLWHLHCLIYNRAMLLYYRFIVTVTCRSVLEIHYESKCLVRFGFFPSVLCDQ